MAGPSQMSPCAACKFLRRKCTSDCLFAPYFPPDQPQKFANVHKIFGASNITKLLHDLPLSQREDAVNSLAYEADARVKDPVYGCVGAISVLQQQVAHLQAELAIAHAELTRIHTPTVPALQDEQEHHPAVLGEAMTARPLVTQEMASAFANLKPDLR